jgi:methylmalonyl-CoA/ethylmalonyl-CoA epimerase
MSGIQHNQGQDRTELILHHIGMLVKSIPESAAFYPELGYELQSEVIHDPIQTAHVQFLRLPADRACLELISPDGQDSKLDNGLRKGGGLHHLCYATKDIEARCLWLQEKGFFPVAEPAPAAAFLGHRIAWSRGPGRLLAELVESGGEGIPNASL